MQLQPLQGSPQITRPEVWRSHADQAAAGVGIVGGGGGVCVQNPLIDWPGGNGSCAWGGGKCTLRVDYISNVGGHFAEEQELQDLLDIIQRVRLQGIELVHQDQGLVGPKAGVVQLFGGPMGDAESI